MPPLLFIMLFGYMPDVLGIVGDSSVRAEFSGIAHIKPLLFSKSKSVAAVVAYAAQLRLNIAFKIAEQIIMIRRMPACAVEQRDIKLTEISASAVGNAAVNK